MVRISYGQPREKNPRNKGLEFMEAAGGRGSARRVPHGLSAVRQERDPGAAVL